MTPETQLISRIVRSASLAEVLEWGITEQDFTTEWCRPAFSILYAFYTHPGSRGAVMGPAAMRAKGFNKFIECDEPGMTTAALCMMTRQERIRREANLSTTRFLSELELDTDVALAKHQNDIRQLVELGTSCQRDVRFCDSMVRVRDQFLDAEQGKANNPISYPWPILNQETLGISCDDFIVFYGRPKSMKSWVLAYLIAHFYHQEIEGVPLRILVYTKEMGPDNIFKRISACMAGVPYQGVRRGSLDPEERLAFMDVFEQSQLPTNNDRLIAIKGSYSAASDGTGTDTVAWFRSKCERYRPNIACIDGAYLMNTAKAYQKDNLRVQSISRDLRAIPLELHIPVIVTFQATRSAAKHNGAELDEIAFTDAISQDVTAAFRVINEKALHNVRGSELNTILLGVAGSREWTLDGLRIVGEPAYDFSQVEAVSTAEMLNAKEADASDGPIKRTPVTKETKVKREMLGAAEKKAVRKQLERNQGARST